MYKFKTMNKIRKQIKIWKENVIEMGFLKKNKNGIKFEINSVKKKTQWKATPKKMGQVQERIPSFI